MAQNNPTKKQQQLLQFVADFLRDNNYSPSYREMAQSLGYKSVSTVATHIDALIAKGYLSKGDEYSARSLTIVNPGEPQAESATLQSLRRIEERLRHDGRTSDADVLLAAIKVLTTPDKSELA